MRQTLPKSEHNKGEQILEARREKKKSKAPRTTGSPPTHAQKYKKNKIQQNLSNIISHSKQPYGRTKRGTEVLRVFL